MLLITEDKSKRLNTYCAQENNDNKNQVHANSHEPAFQFSDVTTRNWKSTEQYL
jgi:hypothetical protein